MWDFVHLFCLCSVTQRGIQTECHSAMINLSKSPELTKTYARFFPPIFFSSPAFTGEWCRGNATSVTLSQVTFFLFRISGFEKSIQYIR